MYSKSLIFKCCSSFSLFTKIPKKYDPPKNRSWLSRIFSQSENSPTYPLLQQLFDYLQNTPIFYNQFPYLKNTERIQQNCMIAHVVLLRNRLSVETKIPKNQISQFNYNVQTYNFPRFAQYLNPAMPTKDFQQHFAQAYFKKLELYDQMTKQYELSVNPNRELSYGQYCPLFRKIIYENRVDMENQQLIKFSKYYYAHRKYLYMLQWNDMIQYQVKWGFEGLKFIEEAGKL